MRTRKNNRQVNRSDAEETQRNRKSNRISKMVTVKSISKYRKAD
jgi:hypothetical protein